MGLLSKAAVKTDTPNGGMPSSGQSKARAFLEDFSKKNTSFHCVALRADTQAVCDMIGQTGTVFDPGNGNCLALFPQTMDRELAAHRLSNSLGVEILCQCEADSPDAALAALGSFL